MLNLATLDEQTVIRAPHDAADPRTSVTMPTPGGELTLFFDPPTARVELNLDTASSSGELSIPPLADGALREVRLVPGTEPWRLMPRLPLYLQYARAVAALRKDDKAAALRALRDAGAGRRGHGDDFYRAVASMYNSLVAAGEPSPIKALAESQPVTISAASKWVKRARELELIGGETDAS